jgi:hypothetical protein
MKSAVPATLDPARAAKAEALKVFKGIADVAGIGVTRVGEGYGVKINLRDSPPHGTDVPSSVGGVPIRVTVIGHLRKR